MIKARAVLEARRISGLTQAQLAAEAMMPLKILQDVEVGRAPLRPEWAASIKVALEKRGVIFHDDGRVEIRPAFLRQGEWP